MASISGGTGQLVFVGNAAIVRAGSDLAVPYLDTAIDAARKAREIETANSGAAHGAWFHEMAGAVAVAVTMSAAALEARSNGIAQDLLEKSNTLGLSTDKCLTIDRLLNARSGSAESRFKKIAAIVGKEVLTTSNAWIAMADVAELRNAFMHFRPKWSHHTQSERDTKLADSLLRHGVPMYPPYADKRMMPFAFITSGCARWAVQSVIMFSSEYSALLGLEDRFARCDATRMHRGRENG